MKRWAQMALAVAAMMAAGCSRDERPTLNIFVWSEYISPEVIAGFEREYGCRVQTDTFDTNEAMYAKLQAGGCQYDILLPSSFFIPVLTARKLIHPLDTNLLPHVLAGRDETYLDPQDPDAASHVPYAVSSFGLATLRPYAETVTNRTWHGLLTNPHFAKRTTLFNDVRNTFGAALLSLGLDVNTTNAADIARAQARLVEWQKHILRYDNEEYKGGLCSGEFKLCAAYGTDAVQMQEDNPEVVFIFPEDGWILTTDDFAIPENARQVALAHAFIDYMYRPENAVRNMARMGCLCPVKTAYPLLPEQVRCNPTAFPDKATLKRGHWLKDVGSALRLYAQAWDEVRAAD